MQLGDGSDAALARAWQAGDVRAFDEAYRRFAPVLFGTAVGLVGDRSAAADVVHDTFLRAATRVGGLRDPARLRAWLFAILRNEAVSVHRVRSRSGGSLDDGPAPVSEWLADTAAAPDVEASRRELADLVWTAADGLQHRDREVLELHLRGGLEAGDLAMAMGVTAGHAAVLLSRMRDRLERCLGALLIARSGRADCLDLDRLLSGWDGRFSLEVRGRVTRHIEGCPACGRRRGALVSLEHLAPVLVPPLVVLPEDLRARLVADLMDLPSAAAAMDPRGQEWAWREDGFPWPADEGEAAMVFATADDAAAGATRLMPGPQARRTALAAVVVLMLLGVGVVTVVVRGRSPAPVVTTVAGPATTDPAATGSPAQSATEPPPGSVTATPASSGSVRTGGPGATSSAAPSRPAGSAPVASPSPSRSLPGTPSTRPTPTPTPSPTPTLAVPTPSPTPTPTPDPPVILRLALSPSVVQQNGGRRCTVLTSTVTVAVLSQTSVTGSVSWQPVDGRTVTTGLKRNGAELSGQIGPFDSSGPTGVSVTVLDQDGGSASAAATLTVLPCR